jgi:molybdenum cofactor synthesis domain-containing protein
VNVAGVVIGNEVLSGKVPDTNGPFLIQRCREWGFSLNSLQVVPDVVDDIVEAVSSARRRAEMVVTSGGIGPTHDDVTVRAVALALGRPVVRLARMEALLRGFYAGRPMPEAALRMAEAPAGARLVEGELTRLPVLAVDHLYILPGVPRYFELQLLTVMNAMAKLQRASGVLHLVASEPEIAAALDSVALADPDVAIGSYPTVDETTPWKVRLTVDHTDARRVAATIARLRQVLPAGSVVD